MMPRILFVIPDLEHGGAIRVVCLLARGLYQAGHQVGIVSFTPGGSYQSDLPPDLPCMTVPHCGNIRLLNKLLRIVYTTLMSRNYDVVVSGLQTVTEDVVYGCKWLNDLRRMPKLYIGIVHSMMTGNRKFRRKRPIYYRFNHVVTVSHGVKNDVERIFDPGHGHVVMIHNPLDLAEISNKAAVSTDLEVPTPYFLHVARLSPEKDQQTLLRAFQIFADRYDTQYHLLLLGDGPERESLGALVRELEIPRVHFLGFDDNPWVYMRHATALLSSSLTEGFPMVIIEAFACGTPVIATDCPSGPCEQICGGENGYLIPVAAPEIMAETMAYLIAHPAETREKVANATRFVQQLDISIVVQQYARLCSDSDLTAVV